LLHYAISAITLPLYWLFTPLLIIYYWLLALYWHYWCWCHYFLILLLIIDIDYWCYSMTLPLFIDASWYYAISPLRHYWLLLILLILLFCDISPLIMMIHYYYHYCWWWLRHFATLASLSDTTPLLRLAATLLTLW
jgi:hypothetical protein